MRNDCEANTLISADTCNLITDESNINTIFDKIYLVLRKILISINHKVPEIKV